MNNLIKLQRQFSKLNKFKSSLFYQKEQSKESCEDAYYFNEFKNYVFDGVGGWRNHGVDPGLYSKRLAEICSQQSDQQSLKQLLIDSHQQTNQEKHIGSTTVSLLRLSNNILQSYIIGDSSFCILRKNQNDYQIHYKSKEQTQGFNFPYQVGSEGDNPNCGIYEELQIQENDLIINATDGLWDNLDENQVLEFINKNSQNMSIDQMTNKLGNLAVEKGYDQNYNSPFAKNALKYRYRFIGGKADDVTILISRVI